jgi:hypothetical protein
MVRFCRDQRQSRMLSGFDEELLIQPSSVWTVKRQ